MKNLQKWDEIKLFIQQILQNINNQLDKESIDAVNHYLDHDEYEMAYEGLFLEIMKLKEIPELDFAKCIEVGKLLNLDKETVFEFDFWNNFEEYVQNHKNK